MELGSAFTRGSDQDDGEALIEGHGHQRRLAVARHPFDADFPGVDGAIRLEIVEAARGTPGPRPQRAPVVVLAMLAAIDQTDDPAGQARAVVGLDAAWIDGGITPAVSD